MAVLTSLLALVAMVGLSQVGGTASSAIRGVLVLLFWMTGPGGALLARLRLTPLTKVALTPLVGLGLLLVLGSVGTWTGVWVPSAATAAVAVLVPTVARAQLRGLAFRLPRFPRPRRSTVVLGVLLLASLGAWVAALPAVDDAAPSVYGLIVSGPVALPLSVAGVTLVLVAGIRLRRPGVVAAAGAGFVVVLRATASVVGAVPTEAWTYKHVGVVVELQEQHHLLAGNDIYMHWPAMFAGAAWFSDATGVAPLDLARWITPLVHVLFALQVAALARVLGADVLGTATAGALAVVLNWVGQDYFAPQAIAICLAGGFLLALVQSRGSRTHAVLAVALFAVIVPTHQLTPFWLLGVAVVLAVFRRVPWLLPVVLLLVLVGYVLPRYDVVASYGLFTGFDPVGNAASNVPVSEGAGQAVGSLFARGAAALTWLSTLLVLAARQHRIGWRRLFRSEGVLVPGIVAFAPFAILGGQSYGGEAVLRVVLYSTIGCAVVLGPALARLLARPTGRTGSAVPAAAGVWVLVVVALASQTTYGTWSLNLIRPADVAAARWLAEEHPDDLVIPVLWNWPGRIAFDYQRYSGENATTDASLDSLLRVLATETGQDPDEPTLDALAQVVRARPASGVWLVTTGTMRTWDEYYREFVPGSYAQLLADVEDSPDWELVRTDGDVRVWAWSAGTD
ncbi:hypothetical protein [Modestobacter sp. SYSU DS0657]